MDNEVRELMSMRLNDSLGLKADHNNMSHAMYKSNNVSGFYNGSVWDFWTEKYYPSVIRESYPVYIREKAEDKGKQAFEIIKALQDKKLMKLDKVSDFIEAMDILIKTL